MIDYTFSSGLLEEIGFGSHLENQSVEVALESVAFEFHVSEDLEDYSMSSLIGNSKFDAELR